MFCAASDFDKRPYNIPDSDNSDFAGFIDREEEDILVKILGRVFYDNFIAGFEAITEWDDTTDFAVDAEVGYGISIWKSLQNPNVGHVPVEGAYWTKVRDDQWLRLKEGDSYLLHGITYKYNGLVKLLTPYIFKRWIEGGFDSNSGIGIVLPTSENSTVISPAKRLTDSYNAFARQVGDRCDQFNTLYGFLIGANLTDGSYDGEFDSYFSTLSTYLDYVFVPPGRLNFLDL